MICRISVSRTHHYTINNNILYRQQQKEEKEKYIYEGKIEKEHNC
jgi:hypothetical protein